MYVHQKIAALFALTLFVASSNGLAQAQTPPAAGATPKKAEPTAAPAAPPKPKVPEKTAAKSVAPAKKAAKGATASDHLTVSVRITDGHTAITRTRRELGFALKSSEPVAFTVDLGTLKAALERVAPAFHRDTAEPRPMVEKGQFVLFEGRDGQVLNVPTTAQAIVEAVAKDPAATKFDATIKKKAPTVPATRYKGIDAALATFSTRTNANPKRNHNVELGASRINGILLAPKQVFSLNQTVGKRTQASGFLTAPVFVDAKEEPGIGGGVSQVTGTLFNAAARAGLKILEAHPHSRPVAYLPVGYDATVAYGDEDMRFENDTAAPVYLDYHFDPKTRRLTATIFGAKVPGRTISLRASVQRLAPGKIDAQLYRVTKKNGAIVSKERLFTHHYRWDPTTKA